MAPDSHHGMLVKVNNLDLTNEHADVHSAMLSRFS